VKSVVTGNLREGEKGSEGVEGVTTEFEGVKVADGPNVSDDSNAVD
jgi:hypothetical protein